MKQFDRVKEGLIKAAKDPQARAALPRKVKKELKKVAGRRRSRLNGVSLPDYKLPAGPVARPDLRVAVILDDFSTHALRYEWDQFAVPYEGWQEALTAHQPDLLFVESAWSGNGGQWRLSMTKATGPTQPLRDLVEWCRKQGVPTVFWNKEDPPNYDVFVQTAALFDRVFTVDADRIPAYQADLGHDRIALLPFAAQPRIHSPVRSTPDLVGDVAFAGTYFAEKHPGRAEQLNYLLPAAQGFDLDIYSRMQGGDDRYNFPARYKRNVVGSLPYEQMLSASRAYPVFLNANSVTGSPTMCARRLFELSAAQTAVVSGPSAAIPNFFGDTVAVVDTEESASAQITMLVQQKELRDRRTLLAHRRVHDEHLYTHRVDTVLEAVDLPVHPRDASISAIVPTMRPDQIDHVLATLGSQVHSDRELILVTHGFGVDADDLSHRAAEVGLNHVVVLEGDSSLNLGALMNLGVQASSGRYVAKMDDDNSYGMHYLSDLVRAFDYSSAQVVGKWAHYVHLASSNATLLRFGHAEHRYVKLVQGGTILTPRDVALELPFEDLPRRVDTTFLEKVARASGQVYSADRFNFISRRAASPEGHTWGITDAEIVTRSSHVEFYGDPIEHVLV